MIGREFAWNCLKRKLAKQNCQHKKNSFFFLRQNDEKKGWGSFCSFVLFCYFNWWKKLFLCFHQTKILLIVKIAALSEWGQNIFSCLLFMGGLPFGLFWNSFPDIKWFGLFGFFRPTLAKFQQNIQHFLTFQNSGDSEQIDRQNLFLVLLPVAILIRVLRFWWNQWQTSVVDT